MVDTPQGHRASRSTSARATLLLTLAAAIAAVVALTAASGFSTGNASNGGQPRTPPHVMARVGAPAANAGVPVDSQVTPERPTAVRLPSGTRVPVRRASTLGDGRLDVPDNIDSAGWWDGGSRIGNPYGTLLIAGHVDSTVQGLGPFAQLLGMREGDGVTLMSQHLREAFEVSAVNVISKTALTDRRSLFSAAGGLRLLLITCSGPFDPGAGGYQNLTVVTATPVGQARRR